jgi:hypothetical protein
MTASIERDLAAFERGELSREEMERMYGVAISPILNIYERLRSAGTQPVPESSGGLDAVIESTEPDPSADVRLSPADRWKPGVDTRAEPQARWKPTPSANTKRDGRSRRSVALLLAATLMLGGTAFASTGGFGLMENDGHSKVARVGQDGGTVGDTDQGGSGDGQGDNDQGGSGNGQASGDGSGSGGQDDDGQGGGGGGSGGGEGTGGSGSGGGSGGGGPGGGGGGGSGGGEGTGGSGSGGGSGGGGPDEDGQGGSGGGSGGGGPN